MGYTVYLSAQQQNLSNQTGNIRLNAWLSLNGTMKGRYLYNVTEDALVESGLGKQGFNTVTSPSVLVANYSIILDNLFDMSSSDRDDFINNPSNYTLNISLKDKINTTYSVGKLGIPLTNYGGLVLQPDLNNTDIFTTNTPSPFILALAANTNQPLQVLNFKTQADDGKVNLFWSKPIDTSYAGVTIKRKIGSVVSSFDDPDAVVVSNSTDVTFVDTNVVNDTAYYYRAFSYNSDGTHNITVVAQDIATPLDDYVPKVSSVAVMAGDSQLALTWFEPADPEDDILGYIIFRTSDGQYPNTFPVRHTAYTLSQTLGNATVVFKSLKGSITVDTDGKYKVIDTGLTNNTLYKYSIYGYDEVPNYYNYAILQRHQGLPTYQEGCQFSGTPTSSPILYKVISLGKNKVNIVFSQSMNTDDLKSKNVYAFNNGLTVNQNVAIEVITTSIANDTAVVYTSDQTAGVVYTVTVS